MASSNHEQDSPETSAAVELWIVDFDNTLAALEVAVDWAASRRQLEPMLRAAVGFPLDLLERHPKGNLPLYNALLRRLRELHHGLTAQDRELLTAASVIIESHEMIGTEQAQALAGADELLRELASRSSVAIVTSNSSRTVARWLERHGLGSTIDRIVGRDSLLALKPEPDMVIAALAEYRVSPARARFIGDSLSDLGAARTAGVPFIGIAANSRAKEILEGEQVSPIFSSPAALLRSLRAAGA